jgi:hydroxymethylpyrimidine pyrophosphatase-like HAD family hydrolase
MNDLAMLDFAGVAFLMGNATPRLQSRYQVMPTNDDHRLAVTIEGLELESRC